MWGRWDMGKRKRRKEREIDWLWLRETQTYGKGDPTPQKGTGPFYSYEPCPSLSFLSKRNNLNIPYILSGCSFTLRLGPCSLLSKLSPFLDLEYPEEVWVWWIWKEGAWVNQGNTESPHVTWLVAEVAVYFFLWFFSPLSLFIYLLLLFFCFNFWGRIYSRPQYSSHVAQAGLERTLTFWKYSFLVMIFLSPLSCEPFVVSVCP